MMKGHVFLGHSTTTRKLGNPDHSGAAKWGEENAKEKCKCGSKGTGREFFGEEQAQDSEWRSEEDCAWCSKGNRGKNGFSKGNGGFQKGGFSHLTTRRGCKQCFNPHKGRGKDQQGKGKEGAYPQSGLSASETLSEKYGQSWRSDDWYSSLSEDSSCWACKGTTARYDPRHTAWIASVPWQAAYGMNDSPRLWWNVLDKALCSFGVIPTQADRCCCVLY